jgi:hypothetical protein
MCFENENYFVGKGRVITTYLDAPKFRRQVTLPLYANYVLFRRGHRSVAKLNLPYPKITSRFPSTPSSPKPPTL